MSYREDIWRFEARNVQEEADQRQILAFIRRDADGVLRRENPAHITTSALVFNPTKTKVLLVFHNQFRAWSWTGGHADGERDLLSVALREVREETGVKSARPVTEDIYSLEVLTVDGHEKRGEYVPSHLHMNVTYLLEADDHDALTVCEVENSGVAWFTLEDALSASTEPWFVERIYKKLNAGLARL